MDSLQKVVERKLAFDRHDDFAVQDEILRFQAKRGTYDLGKVPLQVLFALGEHCRVRKLAAETPALYLAFDLLKEGNKDVAAKPLSERRGLLEDFARHQFLEAALFHLSPASRKLKEAERWLGSAGGGSDGVIAKRLDLAY
jgi:ATP-dependent DNA ligase